MPVIPGAPTYFVDQLNQTEQASSTQMNFRQMVGRIGQWRPDMPVTMQEAAIADAYRAIIDDRFWYGLLVRGVISSPDMYTTGQVDVTNGGVDVVGHGTDWTDAQVGLQFRIGFSTPIYNVASVQDSTHMKLELPFASPTQTGVTYTIFMQLVQFPPNVKRVKDVLNQQQGYRLLLDYPREAIDATDTWRTQVGYTKYLVDREQAPDGSPVFELYPIPTVIQAFPYTAYIQPPDLSDTNDYPVAWIRSDVIVKRALAEAMMFRGEHMNERAALMHARAYEVEIEKMRRKDDSHDLKDLSWDYSVYPIAMGGLWAQENDV